MNYGPFAYWDGPLGFWEAKPVKATVKVADCASWDHLPLVLSEDQAAALFRVSRDAICKAAREGHIPCLRFGKDIRFPRESLRQFLAGEWLGDLGGPAE